MADDKTNLLTEDLALLKNYMNSFYQREEWLIDTRNRFISLRRKKKILKEINIRSEQVIEKLECFLLQGKKII